MVTQGKARIKSILVEKLFGFLSYKIKTRSQEDLIVLYGDNGCGKTTILNLIFHSISPEDEKGHRTFVAGIPFKKFEITFIDGHSVIISRKEATNGPFTMRVKRSSQELASHKFTLTRDAAVLDQDESTYRPLLQALKKLRLGLFLLPDNRRIVSNLYEDEQKPRHRYTLHQEELLFEETKQEAIDTFVQMALTRASNWTRKHALAAASQGETDTNKIYAEILHRIAGPAQKTRSKDRMTFSELLKKAKS
jgi:energy-coupling factor transporter ATP-binding protein EcfA2